MPTAMEIITEIPDYLKRPAQELQLAMLQTTPIAMMGLQLLTPELQNFAMASMMIVMDYLTKD